MELQPTIVAARAHLREGETGKALHTILGALENDPRQAAAVRLLQVVEANYNAARQQELKGILSFQEAQRSYSQVNDALLSALDALESGRRPAAQPVAASPARWVWLAGGILFLLVAGGIAYFMFAKSGKDRLQEIGDVACPVFRGSGPKVLILPFKNVGQGNTKPEAVIQSRIQKLSINKNFPIATHVLTGLDAASLNIDLADGQALGERCGADMVIWGLYDHADSLRIDLRFTTLNNRSGAFASGFQAFRDLPAVTNGKMLSRLDDAIFGICGILAVRSGRADVAHTWFGKMQVKGEIVQNMEQILNNADSTAATKPVMPLREKLKKGI